MGEIVDIGRRIELVPIDLHCQDITIGLYCQEVDEGLGFFSTYLQPSSCCTGTYFFRHSRHVCFRGYGIGP